MKRALALVELSREHHTALSLAMRIARVADSAAEAEMLERVAKVFAAELEPHFLEEERGLLPALMTAGETALVNRTLDEHRQIRALVENIVAGDAASLKVFGELLSAHVRFEERELFVTAQAVLSPDFLNSPR